jgi:hypothetical protein
MNPFVASAECGEARAELATVRSGQRWLVPMEKNGRGGGASVREEEVWGDMRVGLLLL